VAYRSHDLTIFGSTVGYPSDSLASCLTSNSAYCDQCYRSVVCPSICQSVCLCLSHSCIVIKR